MKSWNLLLLSVALVSLPAWSQIAPQSVSSSGEPIYRITVVGRSIKAINYGHREEPTKIGFAGTVLANRAKGEAWVESKQGAVKVEAKFEHLPSPTSYGPQFLTYVLWAITPDGHATNLGEVVPDGGDNAKLHVTSHFQAFGLMVTAEPFYSVDQPSDVVVLENVVLPETMGKIEEVTANTQLLRRRGTYTMEMGLAQPPTSGKKLPMDRYQAVMALYQAQNAVQFAGAEGASRYAPGVYAKAQQLLQTAQSYNSSEAPPRQVITAAREAAQAAEDARLITARGRDEEQKLNEEKRVAQVAAQEAANRARAEAMQQQNSAPQTIVQTGPVIQVQPNEFPPSPRPVIDLRTELYRQLSGIVPAQQNSRGLVLYVSDSAFSAGTVSLHSNFIDPLSRVAAALKSHPELKVEVEGYTTGSSDQRLMSDRAAAVRDYLMQQGITATSMTARGLSMHPPVGSPQYRHVEIIVSGSELGGAGS